MTTGYPLLRFGVIGVGTMGQHHVRIANELPDVTLAGFFDPDRRRCEEICTRHACRCFDRLDDLLDQVDAVSVAAPTSLHEEIGTRCLERGIHLLMEKPLAHTLEGAERLVELARTMGAVLAVGHVERYNPAVAAMMELLSQPREEIVSIDVRRLMPFDGSRCMDVDVLYDLLIHDIDLAIEIADGPIKRVSASGRPVFSHQTDVAHTRIEFRTGTTAVFWTAKCTPQKVRTLTVATPSRLLVADTLQKTLTVHSALQVPATADGICLMGEITTREIVVPEGEPLHREIEDFLRAVREGTSPVVHGERALTALRALDMVARSLASGEAILQ
ncbi:MAG: Gfo/Idh/MocA family oxidoreductase [Thermodesulfobacteriota bacterium]